LKANSDIELPKRLDDAVRNQKLEFSGEVTKLISDHKSLLFSRLFVLLVEIVEILVRISELNSNLPRSNTIQECLVSQKLV
jgi:hypothetical protein